MQHSKNDVWVGLFVLLGACGDFVFGVEICQFTQHEFSNHLQRDGTV